MGKGIHIVALAAALLTSLWASAARADCQIGNCWGAVAFGPGGAWAYAVNHPTRELAQLEARNRCQACNRVLTFHNSCGAYASGPDGYGWGNASSREGAEERAMYECKVRSSECVLRVWGCTSR
jgi:Domain of unknown function (DUF4189)